MLIQICTDMYITVRCTIVLNMTLLLQPNNNQNPNNKPTKTIGGLGQSNAGNHPQPPPPTTHPQELKTT